MSLDNYYAASPVKAGRQVAFGSAVGGAGPLPLVTTQLADPINVVSASVDSGGMKNAVNHLIFTGNINLPLGISVTLNFQITRITEDGCAIKVGPTFTFATVASVLESETFAFQFTDRDIRPGNYTYSVGLSTNSIIDITPGLTVSNAVLTILAVNDC